LAVLLVNGGITGTGNLILNDNNSTITNGITLSSVAVNNVGTITNSGTGTNTVLISAAIGASVLGVVENSATSALSLTGTNLYTSSTTITAGTVKVGSATALGANAATVSVASGAVLDVDFAMTNTNPLTINRTGTGVGALIDSRATPGSYAGAV